MRRLILPAMILWSAGCATNATRVHSIALGNDPLDLRIPLEPMELAVTVDDLPDHGDEVPRFNRIEIADRVIDALKTNRVAGVYGFSNQPLEDNDDDTVILKHWLKAGNLLGNHTYNHPDLASVSTESYVADIGRMDQTLSSLTQDANQAHEQRMFRYPYLNEGDTMSKRNAVRKYLLDHNYRIAEVTVESDDWAWNDAYTRCHRLKDRRAIRWLRRNISISIQRQLRRSQKLAAHIFGRDIKHVLLLHMSAITAITLKEMLTDMKASGVKFIDLATALDDPAYSIDPAVTTPGGMTFLDQMIVLKKLDDPYGDEVYSLEKLDNLCRK